MVLDTGAFLSGFNPHMSDLDQATTPRVIDELSDSKAKLKVQLSISSKKIRIKKPDKASINKVLEIARKTGDISSLSETDIHVLALAHNLKPKATPIIVSDDYSIQNVATELGIKYQKLIQWGIKTKLRWQLYCPACYARYNSDYPSGVCEVCGAVLKRKPASK